MLSPGGAGFCTYFCHTEPYTYAKLTHVFLGSLLLSKVSSSCRRGDTEGSRGGGGRRKRQRRGWRLAPVASRIMHAELSFLAAAPAPPGTGEGVLFLGWFLVLHAC